MEPFAGHPGPFWLWHRPRATDGVSAWPLLIEIRGRPHGRPTVGWLSRLGWANTTSASHRGAHVTTERMPDRLANGVTTIASVLDLLCPRKAELIKAVLT